MNTPAQINPYADLVTANAEVEVPVRQKTWLDRLVLLASNSRPVTRGQASGGQFLLGKDTFLPKEIAVLVLAKRPHAVWLKDNKVHMESFDMKEDQFTEIMAAEQTTRGDSTQTAMSGADYLLFMPERNDYAVIHIAKTALQNLPQWEGALPNADRPYPVPCVLKAQLRENEDFTWMIPTLVEDPAMDLKSQPTPDSLAHNITIFRAPRPQGRDGGEKGGRKGKK